MCMRVCVYVCACVQIRKQPNGKLTLVVADKDGKVTEIPDNDQVFMATGRSPLLTYRTP
jgi:hypothetical protein